MAWSHIAIATIFLFTGYWLENWKTKTRICKNCNGLGYTHKEK